MHSHPIFADLIAAGFDVQVEHQGGLTCVRAIEPKTARTFSARAENEFMAAIFAKGKIDLNLPDEHPLRAAA